MDFFNCNSKIQKSIIMRENILLLFDNSLEIYSIQEDAQRYINSDATLVDMSVSNGDHPVIFVLNTDGKISFLNFDSNEENFSNQITDYKGESSVSLFYSKKFGSLFIGYSTKTCSQIKIENIDVNPTLASSQTLPFPRRAGVVSSSTLRMDSTRGTG